MVTQRLREVVGDNAGVSGEGGDPLSMGLPALLHEIENLLGDRSRPAKDRAAEIEKLALQYMLAGETDDGAATTAESFCMAITGRAKNATTLRESKKFASAITNPNR